MSHCRARGTGVPTIAGVQKNAGSHCRPVVRRPNKRTERFRSRYPSLRRWCGRADASAQGWPTPGGAVQVPAVLLYEAVRQRRSPWQPTTGVADRSQGCPCAACAIAFPVGASPRCEMAEASVLAVTTVRARTAYGSPPALQVGHCWLVLMHMPLWHWALWEQLAAAGRRPFTRQEGIEAESDCRCRFARRAGRGRR